MHPSIKKIILSDKPTGYLLCRYYTSDEKIGYFVINAPSEAKEKVLLASELFIIGSGHIKISSININHIGKCEPIYFLTEIKLNDLIVGHLNEEEELAREYFFIKPISLTGKLPIVTSESTYYQVRGDSIAVVCYCYPDSKQSSSLVSCPIPLKDFFV